MKPTTLWSNLEGFSPRLCSKANLCQFADKSGRHLEGTGRGGTKASKPVHDTLNELPYALLADLFEGVQVGGFWSSACLSYTLSLINDDVT